LKIRWVAVHTSWPEAEETQTGDDDCMNPVTAMLEGTPLHQKNTHSLWMVKPTTPKEVLTIKNPGHQHPAVIRNWITIDKKNVAPKRDHDFCSQADGTGRDRS
jgi:hypothetical protein